MTRRGVRVAPLVATLLAVQTELGAQTGIVSGRVGNGGTPLPRAAVYLEPLDQEIPIQPMGGEIDQSHLRFRPSVLVVTPGTPVRFLNSDPLMHNVFGPGIRGGDVFDLGTYPMGALATWTFQKEGVHVVLCHIHPEMVAYVVVTRAPFGTVTGSDGTFTLEAVPPGRYRLSIWHPRRSRDTMTIEVTVPEGGLSGLFLVLEDGGVRQRGRDS